MSVPPSLVFPSFSTITTTSSPSLSGSASAAVAAARGAAVAKKKKSDTQTTTTYTDCACSESSGASDDVIERQTRPLDIYFDNNATTPISKRALAVMIDIYNTYDANPSSLHFYGTNCKSVLHRTRGIMLDLLDADRDKSTLVFTSGCTEANNMIVKGVMNASPVRNPCIITTALEHDSVLNVVRAMGYNVYYVKCDERGYVSQEHLKRLCLTNKHNVTLVSIIAAQNEIGTIQHMPDLVSIVRDHCGPQALVHVDATQLLGKYRVSVRSTLGDPDFVTGSSHKFHGPKGCGFAYFKDARQQQRPPFQTLIQGGGQELGMRAGTENLAGAVGMVTALQECYAEMTKRQAKIKRLQMQLLDGIPRAVGDDGRNVRFNGDPTSDNGLINTINVTILYKGDHNLAWMMDQEGICVSSASACTKSKKSHVLEAIGVPDRDLRKTIRISLSWHNTKDECDRFLEHLGWLWANVLNKE